MKAYNLLHSAEIPENLVLSVKYGKQIFLHFLILEFYNYCSMSICQVLGVACNHLVLKDKL